MCPLQIRQQAVTHVPLSLPEAILVEEDIPITSLQNGPAY